MSASGRQSGIGTPASALSHLAASRLRCPRAGARNWCVNAVGVACRRCYRERRSSKNQIHTSFLTGARVLAPFLQLRVEARTLGIRCECRVPRCKSFVSGCRRARRGPRFRSVVGSEYHDLCLLTAQTVDVPVPPTRRSDDLRPGERVIAVGFQGAAQAVENRGVVAALYPYDDGYVIRTTASFDFGSSGGGLFDQVGNLVGILAFKARTGENLRFALPPEWLSPATKVAGAFALVTPTSIGSAFWERPQGDRPAFLGVAKREAAGQAP